MPTLERLTQTGMFTQDITPKISLVMISLNELFVAEEFAREINSGRLTVKDAYLNFWSYIEDKKLWDLENLHDDDCRVVLPAWENTLYHITSLLNVNSAEELVDIIAKPYFLSRSYFSDKEYNPFSNGCRLAAKLTSNNEDLRKKESNFMNTLLSLVFEGVPTHEVLDYIANTKSLYAMELILNKIESQNLFPKGLPGTITKEGDNASFVSSDENLYVNGSVDTIKERVYINYTKYFIEVITQIGNPDMMLRLVKYLNESPSKKEDRDSGLNILIPYKIAEVLNKSEEIRNQALFYLERTARDPKHPSYKNALEIIGKLKDHRVVPLLERALEISDSEDSWSARKESEAIAKLLAETGYSEVFDILTRHFNIRIDTESVYAFARLGHPYVFSRLTNLWNKYRSMNIAGAIAETKEERAGELLISIYPTLDDVDEKKSLISSMSKVKSPRVVSFLIKTLSDIGQIRDYRDDNFGIGKEICKSLRELNDPQALDALVDYAYNMEPTWSSEVGEQIKHMDGKRILPRLKSYLQYGSRIDKERALGLLSVVKADESFLDLICKYLDYPDKVIAEDAAKALGLIGSEKAVPALKREIRKKQHLISAAHALGMIGGEEAINALGESLLNFDSDAYKQEIKAGGYGMANAILSQRGMFQVWDPMRAAEVHSLGLTNDSRAVPYLLKYFFTTISEKRIAAASKLAQFQCVEIIPELRKLYSFRNGVQYNFFGKSRVDSDITSALRELHISGRPKDYMLPKFESVK